MKTLADVVVNGVPAGGTYKIVPSALQLVAPPNYNMVYANGTLIEPNLLTLSATATQISCFGGKGSVALSGAGGTVHDVIRNGKRPMRYTGQPGTTNWRGRNGGRTGWEWCCGRGIG